MRAWCQKQQIWRETDSLSEAFGLQDFLKGSIAVIGAGGKTSAIFQLAREFADRDLRVIITTTTRMFREPGALATTLTEARMLLEHQSVVFVGKQAENGKIAGLEDEQAKELTQIADIILVESDGSKRLPLKVPAAHEPVLPLGVDRIILVAGLSGIGAKLSCCCHRAELVGELLKVPSDHIIVPEDIAKMVKKGYLDRIIPEEVQVSILLNQADNEELRRMGEGIANGIAPYSCVIARLLENSEEETMKNYIQELNHYLTEKGSVKTCVAISGELAGKHLIWDRDQLLYTEEEDILKWKGFLAGLEAAKPCFLTELDGSQYYVELLTSTPRLIIFGGGHISVPMAQLGKILGFEVTVIDDRPEFVTAERFKDADRLICCDYDQAFLELKDYKNSYYVVVTPGHKKDLQSVRNILNRSYAYVGMIGSKVKVAKVQKALMEEGFSEEKRRELHAPIGLSLGGQTPSEIAVSIAAEIIRERNLVPTGVIEEEVLNGILKDTAPLIQAMIIEKRGSSPRGNGSRMLVKGDGSIRGTIGGGSVEFAAIQKSQAMLTTGESFAVEEYILSDAEGATLGMVCGGIIKVLFERV